VSRDIRLYLEDIIDAVAKIERFTAGVGREEFRRDSMVFDAVVRNLEIIGEAVKNLPQELRHDTSDLEWRKIAGLRDVLAHGYFSLDEEIVWDVVRTKLEPLAVEARRIIKEVE